MLNGAGAARVSMNFINSGETTGISSASLNDNVQMTNDNAQMYNLAGQKVSKNYKGVVIQNLTCYWQDSVPR